MSMNDLHIMAEQQSQLMHLTFLFIVDKFIYMYNQHGLIAY